MAQKSNTYVLYRVTKPAVKKGNEPSPAEYEYLKQIMHRTGRDDVATTELQTAAVFDKAGAFKQALSLNANWAVGELVSDASGVHVEE